MSVAILYSPLPVRSTNSISTRRSERLNEQLRGLGVRSEHRRGAAGGAEISAGSEFGVRLEPAELIGALGWIARRRKPASSQT